MLPSAKELVAGFLRTNGYDKTLDAFLAEADLPPDTGAYTGDVTIEKVLQEKQTYDTSLNFEKLGNDDDESKSWNTNAAPDNARGIEGSLTSANVLNVSVDLLRFPGAPDLPAQHHLLASAATRELHLVKFGSDKLELSKTLRDLQRSPILTWTAVGEHHILCGGMSGQLSVVDIVSGSVEQMRQDHIKYIVKITAWQDRDQLFIATAGWDNKVNIYITSISKLEAKEPLEDPVATLKTSTNPEFVLYITHPDIAQPVLLVTRRDSTTISYYAIRQRSEGASGSADLIGVQNLAPHSNAWIAFSPSCIAISPQDSLVAAVATSQAPHMKLLIVRLLVPPISQATDLPAALTDTTQAAQAQRELAIADREEAAILRSVNTMAPQSAFSTPVVVWRPDASGVWVNSDDGVIRGVEASTGKVVAHLKGHAPNTKVRCLWAGNVECGEADSPQDDEVLVSGGFDQQLIVWRRGTGVER